jgi:hypothetical protein
MSLTKELVERFQAVYAIKNGKTIGYTDAESQLKELAELVRLTTSKSEELQNA